MKFIENLKKAAENTVNTVAKKTGELVEDSKTKYSIFDLNNEIEKTYTEIGKEIYAGYKEDRNVADFIEEKCQAIDKLNADIDALKQKLED
ncbi:MAG: zinc-ribbon domain-containing protein [Clostridia bacterium]|nr:zinc-ribbon domain-containing protein [Clostridia bacterium]